MSAKKTDAARSTLKITFEMTPAGGIVVNVEADMDNDLAKSLSKLADLFEAEVKKKVAQG